MENNQSAFILFKAEDEKISVDVRFEEDTVWLSQDQMAVLFGKARTTITEHIKNVFNEGELNEKVACRNFRFCVLGCQYHITLYAPTQRTMNEDFPHTALRSYSAFQLV